MHWIRPYRLALAAFMLLAYLLWWQNRGIYSGYYPPTWMADWVALSAHALLIPVWVFSLFKLRSSTVIKVTVIIVPVYFFYFFFPFKYGHQFMSVDECHESCCTDLKLYDDGTFFLSWSTQGETQEFDGPYSVSDDKVILNQAHPGGGSSAWKDLTTLAPQVHVRFVMQGFSPVCRYFEIK